MSGASRVVAVGLLLLPGVALAHSPIKGLDNFYAGFLHPLFVPSHFLAALTLGILCGQQGARAVQPAIVAYLLAIIAGLTATLLRLDLAMEFPLLTLAAATGVLIALDRRLPLIVYVLLGVVAGVMVGIDSAQDELSGRGRLAALLGTAIASYMLLMYALMLAEFLAGRAWLRIGLRVLGSWAAASALLVLSLSLAR